MQSQLGQEKTPALTVCAYPMGGLICFYCVVKTAGPLLGQNLLCHRGLWVKKTQGE